MLFTHQVNILMLFKHLKIFNIQYLEENIKKFGNIRIFVSTLFLRLENVNVHLRNAKYEGDISTYMWTPKSTDCRNEIQKIYQGAARLYLPVKEGRNPQILVSDDAQ